MGATMSSRYVPYRLPEYVLCVAPPGWVIQQSNDDYAWVDVPDGRVTMRYARAVQLVHPADPE